MESFFKFTRKSWGLKTILFVGSPPTEACLGRVFCGRTAELETAAAALSTGPRRVQLVGLYGVGKTVFLTTLRTRLRSRSGEVLYVDHRVYKHDKDIGQVLVRGLSSALSSSSVYAGRIFEQIGGHQVTDRRLSRMTGKTSAGTPKFAVDLSAGLEETVESERHLKMEKLPDPAVAVPRLLKDAREAGYSRVIIALDDLDKRDPETVRKLLGDARPFLYESDCSFILTGHPIGILRDAYSSVGSLFDQTVELLPMDDASLRLLIARYLGVGRVWGLRRRSVPATADDVRAEHLRPFSESAVDQIIARALGIPRVVNIICYNILTQAAIARLPGIGESELARCWDASRDSLLGCIRPDLRQWLDVFASIGFHLSLDGVPDLVYERLRIDTEAEMLATLRAAQYRDFIVSRNGRDYQVLGLLQPFSETTTLLSEPFRSGDIRIEERATLV